MMEPIEEIHLSSADLDETQVRNALTAALIEARVYATEMEDGSYTLMHDERITGKRYFYRLTLERDF